MTIKPTTQIGFTANENYTIDNKQNRAISNCKVINDNIFETQISKTVQANSKANFIS